MNQLLLENLEEGLIMEILTRLPLPSVVCCMCVCKAWFKVVCDPRFAKNHLSKSKSVPALLVLDHLQPEHSMSYKLFDFVDRGIHEQHYNPVAEFRLPYRGKIHGSVNGLLLSADINLKRDGLSICNPVTREYVTIESPPQFVCTEDDVVVYGFGVSNVTFQYKVLRIFQKCLSTRTGIIDLEPEKWVYTLGTGEWKAITTPDGLFSLYSDHEGFFSRTSAQFLKGILHWVAGDEEKKLKIACFDLEKEEFYCFPPPPREKSTTGSMAALCAPEGDSLWFCDCLSDTEIAIWSRRDDTTWEKIHSFPRIIPFFSSAQFGRIFPLKVFIDGDVLFEWDHTTHRPFYHNFRDKSYTSLTWGRAILHTPSFLSLEPFDIEEDVATFL